MKQFLLLFLAVFLFFGSTPLLKSASAAPPNPGPSCGFVRFFQDKDEKSDESLSQLALNDGFWIRIDVNLDLITNNTLREGKEYYLRYDVGNQYYLLDSEKIKLQKSGSAYVLRGQFDFERVPDGPTIYVVDASIQEKGEAPGICNVPSIPVSATADSNKEGQAVNTCIPSQNANCGNLKTAFGNIGGNPEDLVQKVFNVAVGIGGGVALMIMIFASYKLIGSRGDPEAIQNGRALFTAAIIGLLVIIFAAFIIRTIGTGLGIPGIGALPTVYAAEFGGHTISDPPGFKFGNATLGNVISDIIPIILFFAGAAVLMYIIYGGFKYMIARGDPKNTEDARKIITNAIKGLAIIIGVYLIILILQAVLQFNITGLVPTAYADVDLGSSLGVRFTNFGDLFTSGLLVIFPLAGIVFFFMLLWGGIKYMLSRGDDKMVASARGTITSALIGLLIIIGSFIIVQVIQGLTGIKIV